MGIAVLLGQAPPSVYLCSSYWICSQSILEICVCFLCPWYWHIEYFPEKELSISKFKPDTVWENTLPPPSPSPRCFQTVQESRHSMVCGLLLRVRVAAPLRRECSPCPACAGQLDCSCPGPTGALLSLYHSFSCKSSSITSEWQINSLASTYTISHCWSLFLSWRGWEAKWSHCNTQENT